MPIQPDAQRPLDADRRDLTAYARPAAWRNPDPAASYDLVVIGAGPAGLAAAEVAVDRGAKVALIERNLLGGVSLIVGIRSLQGDHSDIRASMPI